MMNLFEGSPVVELHGHHDLPHLGGAIHLEGVTTPQAPDNTGFTTAAHSSFVKAGEGWCCPPFPPPPGPVLLWPVSHGVGATHLHCCQ